MALKRKRPGEQVDTSETSSSDEFAEDSNAELNSFAAYTGSSGAQNNWNLDAFAPYTPETSRTNEAPSTAPTIGAQIDLNSNGTEKRNLESFDVEPAAIAPEPELFEDAGFGASLSALHAAPVDNPEEAEIKANRAKRSKPAEPLAKPEDYLDSSVTTDWSKYTESLPPPLDADTEQTVVLSFDRNGHVPSEHGEETVDTGDPGRLFVRLGKFTATYDVIEPSMVIGRPDPERGIQPDVPIEWDDAISRKHARIFRQGSDDYVEDLGSTNGTKINGTSLNPKSPHLLVNGDLIHLGSSTEIGYYK